MIRQENQVESRVDVELLEAAQFFDRFTEDIAGTAEGRISMLAMSIEPDEKPVRKLLDALKATSRNEVETRLAIDEYTFNLPRSIGGLILPWVVDRPAARHRVDEFDRLTGAGIRTDIINRIGRRPLGTLYTGRSHIKSNVVNSRAYLGGPNLQDSHRNDMVVMFEHDGVANWLHDATAAIAEAGSVRSALGDEDIKIAIDDNTDLLIDVGVKGQSLILDTVREHAQQSTESILYAGQYFPDGEILRDLRVANDHEVPVEIFFNHPSNHGHGSLVHHGIMLARRLSGYPHHFFSRQIKPPLPEFHGKAATFNGHTTAIGSHNLIHAGVAAGTAEMTLIRRNDPAFAHQVRRMIYQYAGLTHETEA